MSDRPLCIELFCGTFGWSQGWHALGGYTVGFDIDHQPYHGPVPPGDDLVLQDVLTLHGSQFKDASLILASSPCQAYSYMAMPWSRAKQIARALRGQDEFPEGYEGYRTIEALNALFEAPKRIQREAIEAAGRFIPLIQENVRGAIPWVGRSAWNFGSYHLWGDVPAVMPFTHKATKLGGGASWYPPDDPRHQPGLDFTRCADRATKNTGGSWFNIGSPGQKVTNVNPVHRQISAAFRDHHYGESAKAQLNGTDWTGGAIIDPEAGTKGFTPNGEPLGKNTLGAHGSKSPARKAASARIARIPYPLSQHIAQVYYPA